MAENELHQRFKQMGDVLLTTKALERKSVQSLYKADLQHIDPRICFDAELYLNHQNLPVGTVNGKVLPATPTNSELSITFVQFATASMREIRLPAVEEVYLAAGRYTGRARWR